MSHFRTRCDVCGEEHSIDASEFEVDATVEQLPSQGAFMTKGITITWDCKCGRHIEVSRVTRFDHEGQRVVGEMAVTGATMVDSTTG